MDDREQAEHDERLVAAATGEHSVSVVVPVAPFGRRATDFVSHLAGGVVARAYAEAGSILGIWKDERRQWSTRRILLWVWTFFGVWLMHHEVTAKVYVTSGQIITPHFLNNAWIQAWMVTEGAFTVAVFGPIMVDYFKNAAPAMTAIGTALRDKVIDPVVVQRRDKAAAAGSDGTEYNE